MDVSWMGHTIGAWKLAGAFDGLYYGFIDGMLDCELKPSRYPAVTIRRIKAAYAMTFIFEKQEG